MYKAKDEEGKEKRREEAGGSRRSSYRQGIRQQRSKQANSADETSRQGAWLVPDMQLGQNCDITPLLHMVNSCEPQATRGCSSVAVVSLGISHGSCR